MTRLTRRIIEWLMRYYITHWRGERCEPALESQRKVNKFGNKYKIECPICEARLAYDTITEFSHSQESNDQ